VIKRKNILKSIAIIILWCTANNANAQDLHFSQFINSPLLTNPANTGFIPEGDYRIGFNIRNQWSSITAFPYKTMSAWGDAQVMPNQDNTGWLGLGGLILRDVAGTSVLTSTKVYGSIAYHQMLNMGSLLSLGFNAGWANKHINTNDLTFPSQWNGKFFDAHNSSGAPLLNSNNINYLDLQVGMNYAYFTEGTLYLNAGFSAMHINRPKETFFASKGNEVIVPVRYTGFLNGSFMPNDKWIINPNVYASVQAKSYEIVGGLNARYNLSGNGDKTMMAGLYYRYKDAFIPMVGLGVKNFDFTFSYDATTSSLKNYNNTRGAFELSIIKTGITDKYNGNRRDFMCPSFKGGY